MMLATVHKAGFINYLKSAFSRYLCVFLFLACCSNAYSQSANLSGKIIDSLTGQPVEYATVSLVERETQKTVTGTISSADGSFSLSLIKAGSYNILIEAIDFLAVFRTLI